MGKRVARAKINLFLRVLGRLPSGFHALRSLVVPTSLADTLTLERTTTPGITIACSLSPKLQAHLDFGGADAAPAFIAEMSTPQNLAVRAATLYLEHVGERSGVQMSLHKAVPHQAGLGGGSADAAAVLLELNALSENPRPFHELLKLGARLGSDVPQAMLGGPSYMRGTGSDVVPLIGGDPALLDAPLLLVKPSGGVPTPAAYSGLGFPFATTEPDFTDREGECLATLSELGFVGEEAEAAVISEQIPGGKLTLLPRAGSRPPSWKTLGSLLRNDFLDVACRLNPDISSVISELRRCGASHALLAGSGSGVIGFFAGLDVRNRAEEELASKAQERGWFIESLELVKKEESGTKKERE
ncbi:MAG: hypothetical protein IT290_05355 [Deltaproteobacteria bacterium]|nr:hypothetical protein [Deltaproteobacteria bacterium]